MRASHIAPCRYDPKPEFMYCQLCLTSRTATPTKLKPMRYGDVNERLTFPDAVAGKEIVIDVCDTIWVMTLYCAIPLPIRPIPTDSGPPLNPVCVLMPVINVEEFMMAGTVACSDCVDE